MAKRTRKLSDWGKEVVKTLIDRDMTVDDLAKGINLSRSYVGNVINGAQDYPNVREKICDYLGIAPE